MFGLAKVAADDNKQKVLAYYRKQNLTPVEQQHLHSMLNGSEWDESNPKELIESFEMDRKFLKPQTSLAKKAASYDSSLYYDQHPDLERLREEDEKAEEEYNQVRKEYDVGSNAAVGKGIKVGALAGMIPGAALGLAKHDLDLGFMGAATGGLLGLSAGAGIAGHHFRKQNPELHKRLWDAMDKADGAQDAHIQRWIDIDEENRRKLR